MVLSENTAILTGEELERLQNRLEQSDQAARREFRDALNPDEMGFVGEREGI